MSRNRFLGRDLQVGAMIRSLFMNALGSTRSRGISMFLPAYTERASRS